MELYRAGKYDRAVVVVKKALQVAEESVGPNHPNVATSLKNMAAFYRETKRGRGSRKTGATCGEDSRNKAMSQTANK